MKWTKRLPKVAGWYWFQGKGAKITVVEVVENRILGMQFNDLRSPRDLKTWPGKWAGPIPPPEK